MREQVLKSLVESTKDIEGAKVENNKFCVSVHYRNVDEKVLFFSRAVSRVTITKLLTFINLTLCFQSWAVVAQRVHDILKNYPRLRLTHGRKVYTNPQTLADYFLIPDSTLICSSFAIEIVYYLTFAILAVFVGLRGPTCDKLG